MAKVRPWTKEELNIIREHGGKMPMKDLAAMLPDRSLKAVATKSQMIGCERKSGGERVHRRGGAPFWTPEEENAIRELYPTGDAAELMEAIPGRSLQAIMAKASVLKVHREKGQTSLNISSGRADRFGPPKLRHTKPDGHIMVYRPEHPKSDKYGYIGEHIVVWEEAHGMYVPDGYDVHHKDLNPSNNDPGNLVLMLHGEHTRLHAGLRWQDPDYKAKTCASIRKANARPKTKQRRSESAKRRWAAVERKSGSDLANMRRSGMSVKAICEAEGISWNTYFNRLHADGIDPKSVCSGLSET